MQQGTRNVDDNIQGDEFASGPPYETVESSGLTGEPSYANKGKQRQLESENVNCIEFSTENLVNVDYIILNYDPAKIYNQNGLYLREILFKGREHLFDYYSKLMTNKAKIRYAVDNVKLADLYIPNVDKGIEILGNALVEQFKETYIMQGIKHIGDVKLFSKRCLYDKSDYSDDSSSDDSSSDNSSSDYLDEYGSYNTPPVDSTELGQEVLSDLDPINIRNLYNMLRTKQRECIMHRYNKTKSMLLSCKLFDIDITRYNLEIIDKKDPLNPLIPTLTALTEEYPH
ncbi:hypothetical protein J1614_002238 [Plenodomus biglobosus]|nr:hypothetical protein J1614_002238 [Plenodomus biglobosus]